MHAILTGAHLEGPYVLVGHSFGGLNVMLYANRYPKRWLVLRSKIAFTLITTLASLTVLPPKSPDESPDLTALRNDVSTPPHNIGGIDWATSVDQVRAVKSLGMSL